MSQCIKIMNKDEYVQKPLKSDCAIGFLLKKEREKKAEQ